MKNVYRVIILKEERLSFKICQKNFEDDAFSCKDRNLQDLARKPFQV